MTNWLILMSGLLVTVLAVAYLYGLAWNIRRASQLRQEFYSVALKLADAPDDLVPRSALLFLRQLAEFAQYTRFPTYMVLFAIKKKLRFTKSKVTSTDAAFSWDEVMRMPDELQKMYLNAIAYFFAIQSFNSVIAGWILRKMFRHIAKTNKTSEKDVAPLVSLFNLDKRNGKPMHA